MCEFCTKHGEGKKWYLNARNYSNQLLSDTRRRKLVISAFDRIDNLYRKYFKFFKLLPVRIPVLDGLSKMIIRNMFIYNHWGQVVPIEDVEKILSMTNSIVRIPCICRKVTTGKEVRSCFLTTLNPESFGMANLIDQSYFGGPDIARFEKISKEEVLKCLREWELMGRFHSIWTHGTPFIGGICSCDNTGCLGLKMQRESTPVFFKAEYLIDVDNNRCVGCNSCIRICPFAALSENMKDKKVIVDHRKCYGCGICRSICKKGALFLKDRKLCPEAACLW